MLSSAPAQQALLSQLDQLVTDSRLQPEQCDLQPLLTLLLKAIAPLPVAQQLDIAGYVFEQLAGVVNERASLMLSAWESWHSTQAPVVDLSGDADLFVQSQALDVVDLFAVAVTAPYPSQRQPPSVRGSAFDEEGEAVGVVCSGALLGLGDAGEQGLCGEAATFEPLDESTMLSTIKSLSHGENIPLWSERVSEGMRSLTLKQRHADQALPLLALQQSLQMPLVEVWLALLLGDTGYQLTRQAGIELDDFTAWSTAFYSGAGLQVVSSQAP